MIAPSSPCPPLSAKLTPPEAGRCFVRSALLDKLGRVSRSARKVWVSAPGGAGKTTLVRSFLTDDPRPLLWYQVDHSDRDPASFFFYLSQTVASPGKNGPPLPLLTPEYLPNLAAFCRNYFRAFFAHFDAGCVLVFDDLQEGPPALFELVLAAVMAELPTPSSLYVISREEPYPCFARPRLNRALQHLGWEELRLSPEESRNFLDWSHPREIAPQLRDRAYQVTQGWLAGLLLFQEDFAGERPEGELCVIEGTELLFDYFAGEVFGRLPAETRDFLLACADLPTVDAALAARLSGRDDAGEILQSLAKSNHFTFRISATPQVYRFHPLFRHFLQNRAEVELAAEELQAIRQKSAELLLADGEAEAAAELLIKTRNWSALSDLVKAQAQALLPQGRSQTLLQWLDVLPSDLREADPWLCYWRGNCLIMQTPAVAREEFKRAFFLFEAGDDAAGSMLSWSMAVHAIMIGWSESYLFDEWIARFDRLRTRYPQYPSPQIEGLMVQGIVKALTWRQAERDDLAYWAERLHQLLLASHDSTFRVMAGTDLVIYHSLVGDLATGNALSVVLDDALRGGQLTSLQALAWLGFRACLEWIALDCEQCLATLKTGRALIEESGVHLMTLRLFGQGILLGLTTGDLPLVRKLLAELPPTPRDILDQALIFCVSADLSLYEGDIPKSIALAELAVHYAETAGARMPQSFCLAGLALSLILGGKRERVAATLQRGFEISRGTNYGSCQFHFLAAYFAFETGARDELEEHLRAGFAIAARQGYLNLHPWRDRIMARLCREALDLGIETDYVRLLARRRNLDLTPECPALTPKEIEVLTWIRQGKTTWEMAKIQQISERTVRFHVANILRKLQANSRSHAVAKALEWNLLPA